MWRLVLPAAFAAAAICVAWLGFTWQEVTQERAELEARLASRTEVLAASLQESVEPQHATLASSSVQRIINRFVSKERVVGLEVVDSFGVPYAASGTVPSVPALNALITQALDLEAPQGEFFALEDTRYVFFFVQPLYTEQRVTGALVLVQNASYITDTVRASWQRNTVRALAVGFVFLLSIAVIGYLLLVRPVHLLARHMKALRQGEGGVQPEGTFGMVGPLAQEAAKLALSLRRARNVASEEARLRIEKLDSPWTAERLKEFVRALLKQRDIITVSNLEPFMHRKVKGEIVVRVPASGVVTALEPVMEACGGTWVATGTGDADQLVTDEAGTLRVPPDEPQYTLQRVWLTDEQIVKFERGFANESLWALCHLTHTRPTFRPGDWSEYRAVNEVYVGALRRVIERSRQPVLFMQDFHFTLVPPRIKELFPDVPIGLFWHIPWPSAETFSICPWRKEILVGMLGADLIGFHTQQFCNNFIDTVSKELEARVDYEQFSVTMNGHTCHIKAFPIGTELATTESGKGPVSDRTVLRTYDVHTDLVSFGVERMDPIKGLLERFRAIERLLELHPEYLERYTHLQVTAPSNQAAERNRLFTESVVQEVERINKRFGTRAWKPIVHVNKTHSHAELRPLYHAADVQVVTSLHEGMNLVSKEFVAERRDELGVLVLSSFAGSARELSDALIVNPYDLDGVAEALHRALTMPPEEQRRRMRRMREVVRSYNIYRWSADFLQTLLRVA